MSGFNEPEMEIAERSIRTGVEQVLKALAEQVGVEQLATFFIEGELVVTMIGENNQWNKVLEEMKVSGESSRKVFNPAINDDMIIFIGRATEDQVKKCPILIAG